MDENDLKMQILNLGIAEEDFEAAIENLKKLASAICETMYEAAEALKRALGIVTDFFDDYECFDVFDRDPVEKTPYLFKSKTRVYDKRPHKQHHVRSNCRKEWQKG